MLPASYGSPLETSPWVPETGSVCSVPSPKTMLEATAATLLTFSMLCCVARLRREKDCERVSGAGGLDGALVRW